LVIEIELFGQLLSAAPRRQTLTLERPMNVQEVAIFLGLDLDEIGLISINGIQSELDDSVPPGCRLCFFPPMSGG
jgi:molybdopterin converting factor small subunit